MIYTLISLYSHLVVLSTQEMFQVTMQMQRVKTPCDILHHYQVLPCVNACMHHLDKRENKTLRHFAQIYCNAGITKDICNGNIWDLQYPLVIDIYNIYMGGIIMLGFINCLSTQAGLLEEAS